MVFIPHVNLGFGQYAKRLFKGIGWEMFFDVVSTGCQNVKPQAIWMRRACRRVCSNYLGLITALAGSGVLIVSAAGCLPSFL